MATTLPSWQTIGDTVGLPGLAAGGYTGAKIAGGIGRHLLRAGGLFAGAPGVAAMTAAGILEPTPAGQGEQPIYVRNPATGQMMLNPNNPAANPQSLQPSAPATAAVGAPAAAPPSPSAPAGASGFSGSPMSPMPASYPFPTQANGMSPPDPSVLQAPASQNPGPQSGNVPLPQARPAQAPWRNPDTAAGGQKPWINPDTGMPMPQGGPQMPDFYNGPGSMNFGQGGAQGGGGLGNFLTGDSRKQPFSLSGFLQNPQEALSNAPNAPFWNLGRAMTGTPNASNFPAPAAWSPSKDWFNN